MWSGCNTSQGSGMVTRHGEEERQGLARINLCEKGRERGHDWAEYFSRVRTARDYGPL